MRKLYFLAAAVLISGSLLELNAQNQTNGIIEREVAATICEPDRLEGETKHPKMVDVYQGQRDAFFSDDFSDPDNWIIENVGEQGEWEITDTDPADLLQFMGAAGMTSTTADNGFAVFNGVQFLLAGSVSGQDSRVEYIDSIDLSEADDVVFQFEQRYRSFNADQTSVEFSIDGGDSWIPYPQNEDVVTNAPTIQNVVTFNPSSAIANQPDVRLRFRWQYIAGSTENDNQFGSGYGWYVDDVSISVTPDNDLEMLNAWYDKWFTLLEAGTNPPPAVPDNEYVKHFEYNRYIAGNMNPLSFAASIENKGLQPQTNVTFIATVTGPDEMEHEFETTIPELAPGETTFMIIEDVMPEEFLADDDDGVGAYTVSFRVEQDEEDEIPGSNFGQNKTFFVNEEFMGNDNNVGTSRLLVDGFNTSNMTRFMFNEEETIEYITFAITNSSLPAENVVFESVFLNIIEGSFLDDPGPNNVIDTLFTDEIEYFITDTDVLSNADNGLQFVTVFLEDPITLEPAPITAEPGKIYSPVLRIPESNEDFLWVVVHNNRARWSSLGAENATTPDASLFSMGNLVFALRMGRPAEDESINVNNVDRLNFNLGQNFPNPTSNDTRIPWELFEPAQNVQFMMHDMQGRVVVQKDLGDRAPGVQEDIIINTGSLAAGMYQYSLQIGNNRGVRKMMVTK